MNGNPLKEKSLTSTENGSETPNLSVVTITPCNLLAGSLRQSLATWGINVPRNIQGIDYYPAAEPQNAPAVALLDYVFVERQHNRCVERLMRWAPKIKAL